MYFDAAKRGLAHVSLPALLVLLALLLSAPAWRVPLFGDDLVQGGKLLENHPIKERGYFVDAHRFGPATRTLFDWFNPGLTRRVMEYGVLPWWTAGNAQQTFWRPLAAATHWLDYRLWPSRPVPMHVHNALWFAAVLVAAWWLYRGLGGPAWVAGLATVLLALNQENWQPLVWIAARNSLITVFFVALTLSLHHRRVRTGGRWWAIAATGSFAAGLAAGEGAVTAAAYLLGYALFLDPRRLKARLLGLLPYAAALVAWRLTYKAVGSGVAHSGLYVDPGGEPLRYLGNLLEWGPVLFLDVFTSPILGKYACLAPQLKPWGWGLAVAGGLLVTVAFLPLLRRERAARFWAFGLVLTLVPACATTLPDDRITLYAMLGAAPLVAGFVAGIVDSRAWLPREGGRRFALQAAAAVLVALHLLQPLPGHLKRLAHLLHAPEPPGPVSPVLRVAPDEELLLVNPPDVMYLSYLPYFLLREGAPLPAHLRILSSGLGDLLLRRTDTNRLELIATSGPLIPARPRSADLLPGSPLRHPLYKGSIIASAFRDEASRFTPGETITLPGLTVRIDRVDGRGLPTMATFTFERSLDDARYRWGFWDGARNRYSPFTPPRVGGESPVPGPLPVVHAAPERNGQGT